MRKIEFTKDWIIANKIAIQCYNKQEADSICRIFNGINDYSDDNIYFGSDVNEDSCCFYAHSAAISYRETVIKASDVIAEYEASKRKIIGYKAPFDIEYYGIRKGDMIPIGHRCMGYGTYRIENMLRDEPAKHAPSEIVEQWEPVYEEVKQCFVSLEGIISHFKGKLVTIHTAIVVYNKETNDPFSVNKSNYDFTPEFEQKLKDIGIIV